MKQEAETYEDDHGRHREKIGVLVKIAERFQEAGVTWALGVSMLLCFKHISAEYHDIDLMVAESDADRVREILRKMGTIQPPNPSPSYRTKVFLDFVIDSVDVDVMAGFSIMRAGMPYDCPLKKEQIVEWVLLEGEKIPLQFPFLWSRYYRLMGREEKAAIIEKAMADGKPVASRQK